MQISGRQRGGRGARRGWVSASGRVCVRSRRLGARAYRCRRSPRAGCVVPGGSSPARVGRVGRGSGGGGGVAREIWPLLAAGPKWRLCNVCLVCAENQRKIATWRGAVSIYELTSSGREKCAAHTRNGVFRLNLRRALHVVRRADAGLARFKLTGPLGLGCSTLLQVEAQRAGGCAASRRPSRPPSSVAGRMVGGEAHVREGVLWFQQSQPSSRAGNAGGNFFKTAREHRVGLFVSICTVVRRQILHHFTC